MRTLYKLSVVVFMFFIPFFSPAQQIFSTWADPTGHFSTDRQPALLCGLGLCPTLTNPEAIADASLDNFALIEFPALSVLGSASITVDLPQTVTGSVGGIKVSSGTNLSVLSVLPSIEISLLNNSTVVSTKIYATLASLLGMSSAEPTSLCTEPASATVQYNKIRFSVSVPVGVNSALQFSVYNAYANPPNDCNVFGVLPIRLGEMKSFLDRDCLPNFSWTTMLEVNTKEFRLERRIESENDFSLVKTFAARGGSGQSTVYEFRDLVQVDGLYFYRLRSVDFDGTSTYYNFNPVKVNCGSAKFSVYPTIARDRIFVRIPLGVSDYRLMIRNAAGPVQRLQLNGATGSFPVNIAHLPAGLYIIQLMYGGSIESQKIVVQ